MRFEFYPIGNAIRYLYVESEPVRMDGYPIGTQFRLKVPIEYHSSVPWWERSLASTNKIITLLPNYEISVEDDMPLTKKGRKIERAMDKEYGDKKGKKVFFASANKGTIKGVEKGKKRK